MDLITALKIGHFYEADEEQDILPVCPEGSQANASKMIQSDARTTNEPQNTELKFQEHRITPLRRS